MREVELLALKFQIEALSLKEYLAPWLKNATTIVRDPATGQFAKKASSTTVNPAIAAAPETKEAIAVIPKTEDSGFEEKLAKRLAAEQARAISPEKLPKLHSKKDRLTATRDEIIKIVQGAVANPLVPVIVKIPIIMIGNRIATILNNNIETLDAQIYQSSGKGFSLQKRVDELKEVEAKEGKDSPRYKWRKMVIDAELKYGESLDRVPEKGREEIISKLKKSNPPESNYQNASHEDSYILKQMGVEYVFGKHFTSRERTLKVLETAKEKGKELQELVNKKLDIRIAADFSRPFAVAGKNGFDRKLIESNNIKDGWENADVYKEGALGYINIGDVANTDMMGGIQSYGTDPLARGEEHIRENLWHETGHLIEGNCGFTETSIAFREDRGKETPIEDRSPIDPRVEIQMPNLTRDRFYNPYVGFQYKAPLPSSKEPVDINSEVLSTGVEALASDRLIKKVATMDREHLLYAIAALDAAK